MLIANRSRGGRKPGLALPGRLRALLLPVLLGTAVAWEVLPDGPAAARPTARESPGPAGTRLGTVEGRIRMAGDSLPGPTSVANTTDPGVCAERQSLEDLIVSSRTRGIANVIVTVVDGPPSGAAGVPRTPSRLVLDNRDCRFVPHAAVIAVGDTIEARNSDSLLHTVHYYGAIERNLSLPRRGITRATVVDAPGMIVVRCDVHGWMQAFVRVNEHLHHAVTDSAGAFRIPDLAEGDHTLELWHERLGTQRVSVRVEAGETAVLEAEYRLDASGPDRNPYREER